MPHHAESILQHLFFFRLHSITLFTPKLGALTSLPSALTALLLKTHAQRNHPAVSQKETRLPQSDEKKPHQILLE